MRPAILVLAKAPAAGVSKTRLCPPLGAHQAAGLAREALLDTLDAVGASDAGRRVLVLSGEPGAWLPSGFELLSQRGTTLDERITAAFADAGGPAVLIGMDTPQVSATMLDDAMDRLCADTSDAVLGGAEDGGWWALGLRGPDPRATLGIPMSTTYTGRAQRLRLRQLGYRVADLPRLRDVDTVEDATAVAAQVPASRFANEVRRLLRGEGWGMRAAASG